MELEHMDENDGRPPSYSGPKNSVEVVSVMRKF